MYEKAYQAQPSAKLAIQLFRLYSAKGEPEQGMQWLEAWLELTPEDSATRLSYATVLQGQGRKADAISQYEKVLPTAPDNVIVLNNLAWLYHEQDDSKAIELSKKAYELAPKRPEIADTYGWILVNQGAVEQGLAVLQGALLLAPDHPEIAYHVGYSLNKAGRAEEAGKLLRRIVRDHPSSPFAEQSEQLLKQIN